MKHRAKAVHTDSWIYGRYEFVEGYHVIYEEGKENYPIIIRYVTLEEVK